MRDKLTPLAPLSTAHQAELKVLGTAVNPDALSVGDMPVVRVMARATVQKRTAEERHQVVARLGLRAGDEVKVAYGTRSETGWVIDPEGTVVFVPQRQRLMTYPPQDITITQRISPCRNVDTWAPACFRKTTKCFVRKLKPELRKRVVVRQSFQTGKMYYYIHEDDLAASLKKPVLPEPLFCVYCGKKKEEEESREVDWLCAEHYVKKPKTFNRYCRHCGKNFTAKTMRTGNSMEATCTSCKRLRELSRV